MWLTGRELCLASYWRWRKSSGHRRAAGGSSRTGHRQQHLVEPKRVRRQARFDLPCPLIQCVNICRGVVRLEKLLEMFIEQLIFVVGGVRALAVPRHDCFREFGDIHRLRFVLVRRAHFAAFSPQESVSVSVLIGDLDRLEFLVIAPEIAGLHRALRVGVNADPVGDAANSNNLAGLHAVCLSETKNPLAFTPTVHRPLAAEHREPCPTQRGISRDLLALPALG